MTTYTWPANLKPVAFEMRVMPNERVFRSAFNPAAAQVVDMGGDYWMCTMTLPLGNTDAGGAEIEALLARLRGSQNCVALYHLKRPLPRGTMRGAETINVVNGSLAAVNVVNGSLAAVTVVAGTPMLATAIQQFATSGTISCRPGRTLAAGDLFGCGGQLFMQLTDTVADANGQMSIEFAPAARSTLITGSLVSIDRPTAAFRLREGSAPPVTWRPGMYEGITLDLVEAI